VFWLVEALKQFLQRTECSLHLDEPRYILVCCSFVTFDIAHPLLLTLFFLLRDLLGDQLERLPRLFD